MRGTKRMITGKLMKGVSVLMGAMMLTAMAHPHEAVGQAAESFELSGRDVAVYNLAGEVSIVQGRGSSVVVRVVRGGDDARELEVEVGEIDGRETLRVIYPSDRVVYSEFGRRSNSTVRVSSDGTFYDGSRDGDPVEIRGAGRGLEAHADLDIEVPAGREFALYLAVGSTDVRGVDGDFLIDTGSGSVVAENLRGSLNVDTGSGHVSVRGVVGDVTVDTGSGGVDIADVAGREINVDTGSGGVEGAGLSARSLHIDTGSGGIDLERVDADDIHLDTGSGSIRVQLESDVTELDVDTGSGSVTVWLPEDVGAEVEIETGGGGIDVVDFPIQLRRVSRDHLEGSLGDGEGRIRIDTGSGRVRIAPR
jgi:lia operon protein LiaG